MKHMDMECSKVQFVFILVVLSISLGSCSFFGKRFSNTSDKAPDHSLFDSLLRKHINANGLVHYRSLIQDSAKLNSYLELLSTNAPDQKKWSVDERLAYWINAYNGFTLQLVIRHYPVESIKDISGKLSIPFVSTSWDIPFIEIGGEKLSLNRIEHGILRREFKEPRIHFAINCASASCPVLRAEAYTPEKLEKQLDAQARLFINDASRNLIITTKEAELSKIFSWFSGDFKTKKHRTIIEYINQYSKVKLDKEAKVRYMAYDWTLNDAI